MSIRIALDGGIMMHTKLKQQLESEDPVHLYPGTNLRMFPGDILYSHKYAFSSFLVGHTAIVGENFRIYHVNRWQPFGHADSMPIYLSRHKKREKLTVLRHDNEKEARNAARWAMDNYDWVKRYVYYRDLRDIENNYCSKFVWQAFYFGNDEKVNLLKAGHWKFLKRFVMPGSIYRRFKSIARFENTLYPK